MNHSAIWHDGDEFWEAFAPFMFDKRRPEVVRVFQGNVDGPISL